LHKIDWNDGQFWRWNGDGFFIHRWNGDGFENFSPSPLIVFGGINHWQQWFFNGFFFQFWGPMVHNGYKVRFATK